MAVRPSLEIETPAWGGTTVETPRIARSTPVALATAACASGVRGDRAVVVDDDHLEAGGTEAGEVLLDDGPGGDGLAVRGLPTGAGQCVLDVDGEDPEDDEDQEPRDEHPAEVGGGPGAEAGEGSRVVVAVLAGGQIGAGRPGRRQGCVRSDFRGDGHGGVLC